MSTFVTFTPSTTQPFSFQPTLAGTQYNAQINSNAFGQRWYLVLTDLSGNLILCRALAESGAGMQASFAYALPNAVATTVSAHNIPVGTTANLAVSGTSSGFDGSYTCLATSPTTLTYAIPNPDIPTPITGTITYQVNLLAGYNIGTLLWHADTQQFEYE